MDAIDRMQEEPTNTRASPMPCDQLPSSPPAAVRVVQNLPQPRVHLQPGAGVLSAELASKNYAGTFVLAPGTYAEREPLRVVLDASRELVILGSAPGARIVVDIRSSERDAPASDGGAGPSGRPPSIVFTGAGGKGMLQNLELSGILFEAAQYNFCVKDVSIDGGGSCIGVVTAPPAADGALFLTRCLLANCRPGAPALRLEGPSSNYVLNECRMVGCGTGVHLASGRARVERCLVDAGQRGVLVGRGGQASVTACAFGWCPVRLETADGGIVSDTGGAPTPFEGTRPDPVFDLLRFGVKKVEIPSPRHTPEPLPLPPSPAVDPSASGPIVLRETDCAICCTGLRGRSIHITQCGHPFHAECIERAARKAPGARACPICRQPLDAPRDPLWPTSAATTAAATRPPPSPQRRPPPAPRPAAPVPYAAAPFNFWRADPDGDVAMLDGDEDRLPEPPAAPAAAAAPAAPDLPPSDQHPLSLSATPEFAALPAPAPPAEGAPAAAPVELLVAATVRATRAAPGRVPIDLVCVIDISGSMSGRPLELVKRVLRFIAESLTGRDRFALVLFESAARRPLRLTRMDEPGRVQAGQVIGAAQATGGTNIWAGLQAGLAVLSARRERNPVSSVLLLTDGEDSTGVSADSIVERARAALDGFEAGSRPTLHTFGFGAQHNALLLQSLAECGGGSFEFVSGEESVATAFGARFGALVASVARALSLRVTARAGVRVRGVHRTGAGEARAIAEGSEYLVPVGDMASEEAKDVIIRVELASGGAPQETGWAERLQELMGLREPPPPPKEAEAAGPQPGSTLALLDLELAYTDVQAAAEGRPAERTLQLAPEAASVALLSPGSPLPEPDARVDRQRNRLVAADALSRANRLASTNDVASARACLSEALALVRGSRAYRERDALSLQLEGDLRRALEDTRDQRTYTTSGRYTMSAMHSSHTTQSPSAVFSGGVPSPYATPQSMNMSTRAVTSISGRAP